MSSTSQPSVATFASGCFWGTEHIFLKHYPIAQDKGILKTAVGYTGGKEGATDPDYREVCSGRTGHAEAVRIEFDPAKVAYDELVGKCPHYPVLRSEYLIQVIRVLLPHT
jgi:peptide-methionine (S)-S-oxide reductase